MGERPLPSGRESVVPRTVISRSGGIAVKTTERGLPTHLKIAASEMSRAPEDLAREILSVCQLSAMRLQVQRRRDLLAHGVTPAVIRDLKLATEEDLATAEGTAGGDDGALPETWLRSL
jgi:hypothetical protein